MSTKLLAISALFLLLIPTTSKAQECGYFVEHGGPRWFRSWFHASEYFETHEFSCSLNPFYLQGDFNGRGETDIAVLVTEKSTLKKGILVVHRETQQGHMLGAGITLGNGGDDFRWLGHWRVEDPPNHQNAFGDPLPKFRGELLYVIKPGAASAWVGWDGSKYVWYQGGD